MKEHSVLMKWLKENNYILSSKESKEIETTKVFSHSLYTGGIVYLPDIKTYDAEYKFLQLYAEDLSNDIPLYYIEQRPLPNSEKKGLYKFMIDLDIYHDHYFSNEEFCEVANFITNVVHDFYGHDDNFNVILCKSGPKIKNKKTHSGLHMIYPKLFVNNETAKCFRSAVLQKIKDASFHPEQDWSTVFDVLIYESVGYTMIGSSKREKIIDKRRVYMPFMVIDKYGANQDMYLDRLLSNKLDMMLDTSIRYIPESFRHITFEGTVPTQIPSWFDKNTTEEIRTKKSRKKNDTEPVSSISKDIISQDYIYNIISETIRKNCLKYWLTDYYCDVDIKDIHRYSDDSGPNCGNLLIVPKTSFCMNIGRNHNSCGIFFHASRRGIVQKCLCPCQTLDGRKNGYCSKYTSPVIPFSADDLVLIFDEKIYFRPVQDDTIIDNTEKTNDTQKTNDTHKTNNTQKTKEPQKPKEPQKIKPKIGTYKPGMTSKQSEFSRAQKEAGLIMKKLMSS